MGTRAVNGPPVIIVAFPPEIDATSAGRAYDKLSWALASGASVVVADLTATRFCDSAGIRCMLMAHNRAVGIGAQLRLAVSPGGPVAQAVELMGVGQLLAVYATANDATAG
jgi:anti-sigma B factor antagonist